MANPLSYPVQGVPVPVTVNEAYFALGRVLLPEPDYLPPTEAHKQTASSGKAPDEAPKLENANQRFAFSLISDHHGSYLAGCLLMVAYLSRTLVGCLLTPPCPHAAISRLIGSQAKRADGRKAPLWG